MLAARHRWRRGRGLARRLRHLALRRMEGRARAVRPTGWHRRLRRQRALRALPLRRGRRPLRRALGLRRWRRRDVGRAAGRRGVARPAVVAVVAAEVGRWRAELPAGRRPEARYPDVTVATALVSRRHPVVLRGRRAAPAAGGPFPAVTPGPGAGNPDRTGEGHGWNDLVARRWRRGWHVERLGLHHRRIDPAAGVGGDRGRIGLHGAHGVGGVDGAARERGRCRERAGQGQPDCTHAARSGRGSGRGQVVGHGGWVLLLRQRAGRAAD